MRSHRILNASIGALLCCLSTTSALAEEVGLRAIRVSEGPGALLDPDAAFWKDAEATTVEMQPQMAATPNNPDPAIIKLTVKAAHNGQWSAFLIEWADATKSDRIVVDQFGDQVAVELPVKYDPDALPSPMMGDADNQVTIIQWRAAFQRDIDEGEPKISDLYPYVHVDIYPAAVLRETDARPYMGALGVDNPISRGAQSPVLEQMARGFGTLTVKPDQSATGKGVWSDGRWRVVISHPMATGNENDAELAPGGETVVAFAVWEGGHREVGARKAWSNWVALTFAE